MMTLMTFVLFLVAYASGGAAGPAFADTIENFESGRVKLLGYPGQDVHPDSWCLDSLITRHGSRFALKLFGNTWKLMVIDSVALDTGTVWQVSARVEELGEIHGFGLRDSQHTLFYSFAGTEQVHPDTWVTVYQGAFPLRIWHDYRLPVGADWLARFGYLPMITTIVFVNDRDTDPSAVVRFDDILDITADQPVPPRVEAWYEETGRRTLPPPDAALAVTVRFFSRVTDPDSREHDYYWAFGDGETSRDSSPEHTYVVRDDHEYTALLQVRDSTDHWGRASCRVRVDPGPTTLPVRLNFVGDIMLARRYENPGGVIDTLGLEGIFRPTRPWLGDAADVTVANLESPLTARGVRHPTKPIVFRGRPENVAGLAFAGIDVVSLAHNHIIDYGLEGMRETQDSLGANAILHGGAGADAHEAARPAFSHKSGLSFAFLALCNRTGQYDNYQPYLNAGYDKPGFDELTGYNLARRIEAVRPHADIVVVQMHAGEEYFTAPDDDDEWYSPAALAPTASERALRHLAIDSGADLVICHHPHVLQGLEVYRGRLIAHSLGNFAFDQEYPETYPSAILSADAAVSGISSAAVLPVYIDDYVPRRATGELGTHILDYLAQRSRELNTVLIVDRESVSARVVFDTAALQPFIRPGSAELVLREEESAWVSHPIRLPRAGSLSALVAAQPQRDWQIRIGRELVWFAGFEDEGATLWNLNEPDERYDTIARRGRRSLRQSRAAGLGAIITDLEERLLCPSETAGHTLYGSIRTDNTRDAEVTLRLHAQRTGSVPIAVVNLTGGVGGTTGWTDHHRNFTPPSNTRFLDLRLSSAGPITGTGQARFDDVGIIEWDDWRPFTGRTEVLHPNNYYRVQLRTTVPTPTAILSFEETDFDPPTPARERPEPRPAPRALEALATPGPSPILRFTPTAPGPVTLRLYNALGQEVRTLADHVPNNGSYITTWDGKDNRGRSLPAGAYFCRARPDAHGRTVSVILLGPR